MVDNIYKKYFPSTDDSGNAAVSDDSSTLAPNTSSSLPSPPPPPLSQNLFHRTAAETGNALHRIEDCLERRDVAQCVRLMEQFIAQHDATELLWREMRLMRKIIRQVELSQGVIALRDFILRLENLQDEKYGRGSVDALLPGWMYTHVLRLLAQSDAHIKEAPQMVQHVMDRVLAAAVSSGIGKDLVSMPVYFKRNYFVTRSAFLSVISQLCHHLMNHEALAMYELMKSVVDRLRQQEVLYLVQALAKLEQNVDILNIIYDVMMVNSVVAIDGQGTPICIDDFCHAIVAGYARSYKNSSNWHSMAKDFLSLMLQIVPEELSVRPFGIYVNGLCRSGKMDLAEEALEWLDNVGIAPNDFIYGSIIIGFAEVLQLDKAEQYVEEMRRKNMEASPAVYHVLMRDYVRAGNMPKAEEIMQHLQNNGMAGPETTDMFIDGLVKAGKTQEAFQAFRIAKQNSKPFSVKSTHALLQAAMIEKKSELLRKVIIEMQENKIQPNNVTTSILSRALVAFGEADKVVAQLIKSPNAMNEQIFDVRLFNSLIVGLVAKDDIDTAYKVLKMLESDDLPLVWPTNATYNLFATELLKRDDAHRANKALALLRRMRRNGLQPNTFSQNIKIFSLYQKGQHDRIGSMFRNVDRWGVEPDMHTVKHWINHLTKHEFANDIDGLVNALKERILPRMDRWCLPLSYPILECLADGLLRVNMKKEQADRERTAALLQVVQILEDLTEQRNDARNYSVVINAAMELYPEEAKEVSLLALDMDLQNAEVMHD